jgi:hypothetical protein
VNWLFAAPFDRLNAQLDHHLIFSVRRGLGTSIGSFEIGSARFANSLYTPFSPKTAL